MIGEKGKLLFPHNEPIELIQNGKSVSFTPPKQTIPRVAGENPNHAEWVNAMHGNAKTHSNFAYAGRLTEVVQAGRGRVSIRPADRLGRAEHAGHELRRGGGLHSAAVPRTVGPTFDLELISKPGCVCC